MLDVVRRQVEQLTKEAMAQERKAKENGLLYLESERRRRLAEKHLRSAMRGLEESSHQEAELQRLLEETFDQSLEEARKEGVAEFRQSLEVKALIKEALESLVNMLGSALLDWGFMSREDLEGLDMNECILSESRSYRCPFFKMSAERMGRMFAFVSNMKVAIPLTEAEMARAERAAGGVPAPEEELTFWGKGTSEWPLVVSPLCLRDPMQDVPRTPGADFVVDSDSEVSRRDSDL
ncbi:hypothetical protein AXF42_Ash020908 [Apostasia shenzhenica]|uniref:Uncharacterized protein n=1 Tax=Apostasia shenzhenica TaxID=1088818 RepID=A0A2I0AD95_9ASPA|nr:hypothetical protein AXF42_Ash020908 [Apostasia shenzhenica]